MQGHEHVISCDHVHMNTLMHTHKGEQGFYPMLPPETGDP